jgi:uncharacterized protein
MPPALTYPGVYIAEASSGVHTITGVATSIGAFFGQASMGPINTPVECFSYSDYARTFGPPVSGANLAQSVQQFFSNGGSDCFVVRLADSPHAAQITLLNIASEPVLQVSASSPGFWGTGISLVVDYNTPSPDSTFNLQVTYSSNGSVVQTESFSSLFMDPASPRYAPSFITQSSQLLTATAGAFATTAIAAGYSEARSLVGVAAGAWNAAILGVWPLGDLGSFQISVDGGVWTPINLSNAALAAAGPTDAGTFAYIQGVINAALSPGNSVLVDLTAGGFLVITSSGASKSSVLIRSASASNLARPLMLGPDQGGIEVTRYADLRPVPNGVLFAGDTSGVVEVSMDALANANLTDVTGVTINGVSKPINLTAGGAKFYQGSGGPKDFDGVRENLQLIANAINAQFPGFAASVAGYRLFVRNLNPSSPQSADTFAITSGIATFVAGFVENAAAYSLGISTGGTYWAPVLPAATDGNPPTQAEYLGAEANRTGFYALDGVDLFNIMVIPGDGIASELEWQAIRLAAAGYCQSRRAFLVLDAPVGWTQANLPKAQPQDVQSFRSAIGAPDINCAVYYPRVQINDNGTLRYVGPSGMIAGVYAATDASRGVWKAPAGTNAALAGVTNLEVVLTDKQNGVLNPLGVNCLRRMPAGFLVWGARTVAGFDNSGNSDWIYVPVRRMTLFLEESLYRGTQWAVFEPNDEPLWAQIRMNINAFMMGLFRQGAFQGATPTQAFFVKCDSETTTQADIDQGIVNIIVGFAPLEPAEFVVITIQQIMGNLS